MYVSYKSSKPVETPQKDFTESKLPSDFALAINSVNIEECPEYTLNELIRDCAGGYNNIICGVQYMGVGGMSSCTALNNTINKLANITFDKRGESIMIYSENIHNTISTTPNVELINISYRNCTNKRTLGGESTITTGLYPSPGIAYIRINMCRRS